MKLLLLLCLAGVLQACAGSTTEQDLLESRLNSSSHQTVPASAKQTRLNRYLATETSPAAAGFAGFSQPGTDQLLGNPVSPGSAGYDKDSEDVMLNLVAVSIPQAAKSVLSDVLGLNYSVDVRVTGSVTLQTPKAISRSQLLQLFEAILRDNGAALVAAGEAYRIIPLAEAAKSTVPLATDGEKPGGLGIHPEIISLNYISAGNMRDVLDPMIPPGMLLTTDEQRNALILSGTAQEIAAIRETISVFDVDWMRGMSFALVPVKSSSPASIVQDLEQVFDSRKGPLKGVVRFVPNDRLHAVLIISKRAKYLQDATRWIRKIDVLAQSSEDSLHVYHVQNRNATDLAAILDRVIGTSTSQSPQAESHVAPKYQPAAVESHAVDQGANMGAAIVAGPETPAQGMDVMQDDQNSDPPAGQPQKNQTKIVADDANNALLIYCSDPQFERIREVLREIDAVPNQVLLEAVIAEVSLDDDLKFGVRWFLGENSSHGTFSDATSGAVSSVFPGFSYFLKANDIAFSLNAISSVTNVRVLSAPSLVVLDNKTATLQVGDQVPVVTQSAKAVTAADSPIVTNVELKDTGLILKVTPRVNDSGLVTLDIEQEVSSVVKTTTSGIDSPTIRQRKMKTSVVVNDGEALALGGLIQEKETTGKSKVPILGDIPGLGVAFRQKENAVDRTELVIFIRPRVIRDMNEARRVTDEFRKELSVQAPRIRKGEPTPGGELLRIIN